MIKINEKYLDFIKSDESSIELQIEKYHGSKKYDIQIDKKPLKNPDFLAIYITTKDDYSDPFSDFKTKYLCTINKNTNEILHVTGAGLYGFDEKFLLYDNYSDISNKQHFLNDTLQEIERLLLKKLKAKENELLSKVNLDDYKSEILERFKSKQPEEQLAEEVNIKITFDVINDFYTEPKKFISKYVGFFFNEKNIEAYTRYAAIEKGHREYVEFLENDEVGKTRNELIKILDNPKYKTLKIKYLKPNGTTGLLEYSKDNYHFYGVKNEILKEDKIENIPIKAIETITWSRSTLYQVTEEQRKKMKYSEKEHIDDFLKLKHLNGYPNYVYNNEDYIQRLFDACGSLALTQINKDLLNSESFMKKFIENNPNSVRAILAQLKKTSLLANEDFVKFALSKLLENKKLVSYEVDELLELIDPSLLNNLDIAKTLFSTHHIRAYDKFLKFDKKILNEPEIIDEIAKSDIKFGSYSHTSERIIELFETSKTLLKIFNIEDLRKYISYIDESLLTSDKALLMLLLEDMTIEHGNKLFANRNNNYLESYKTDNEVMQKIIKIATGTTVIDKIAAILKINPQFDQTKIYELSSENIEFLKKLNDEKEINLYFEDEVNCLTNDIEFDGTKLSIKSAYGSFVFTPRYSSADIEFKDFNGHSFKILNNKKIIEDTALFHIKKMFPSHAIDMSKFITEKKDDLEAHILAKNINNEDYDR